MEKQETDLSNGREQETVWNAFFDPILTSENYLQKGQLLYIGYVSAPNLQKGSEGNPFMKRLRLVALNRSDKRIIWQRVFTYEVERMSVYTGIESWLKVVENTIYLWSRLFNRASGSWLVALDARTGQEMWQQAGDAGGHGGMIVCNGVVFLRNPDLQALDRKTGKLLWNYNFMQNGYILGSSLSATKDAVFVMEHSRTYPEQEAFVRSLHLTSGEERWKTSLGTVSRAFSSYSPTLLLTENTIYAVKGSNQLQADKVIALRVQDGTPLWTSQDGIYEKPLLVKNNVLLVSGGEMLSGLNASTGEPLWTQRIEGLCYFFATPDGKLYGFDAGRLSFSSLDITTGKRKWSQMAGTGIAVDKTSLYMIRGNYQEISILERATGKIQQLLLTNENEAERIHIIGVG